jgi:UDP-glucose 4-epimerase
MILVIGGAGYIGSHMCRLLRENQEPHIVLDSLVQGHRASVDGSKLVIGDLGNRADLDRVFREHEIDLVMHFAAFISVGESVLNPGKYWHNNAASVLNLLDAMRDHKVSQFVFSSTAAVYGEPIRVPIDEDHPKNPTSPYGDTKLTVERMLGAYGVAHGLRAVALRYFNAAGAEPEGRVGEDHSPEEHLVPLAIQAAMGVRPPLKVFGSDYETADGTCVRDYVHVLDISSAHLSAAKHLRAGGESRQYNLGNGEGFSVRQVIETVEKVSGKPVPHADAPRRPGDPAKLIASSDRIRKDWAWSPKFPTLESIVETAWKWHSLHPNGFDDRA